MKELGVRYPTVQSCSEPFRLARMQLSTIRRGLEPVAREKLLPCFDGLKEVEETLKIPLIKYSWLEEDMFCILWLRILSLANQLVLVIDPPAQAGAQRHLNVLGLERNDLQGFIERAQLCLQDRQ